MTLFRFVIAAVVALFATCSAALAQTYPSQTVRIVVPFTAGSVSDVLARILANDLTKRWNQQVIIENRIGIAGTNSVAKATPDGYTLILHSNGHTVAHLVNKNLPYDPVKDFAGISRVANVPLYLILNPEVPAKNLKEVIALAKAKPGTLNFSSPGLASSTYIAGALFRKAADIKIQHVPFKGAPESVNAVLRGDAHMYFAPVNLTKQLAEAGKIRAIAAVTAQRIPSMPDVPTFTEAGLAFVYDSWFGLMAPAGLPAPVMQKLSRDVTDALQTPEVKARLAAQFVLGLVDKPGEFDKIIRDDVARLTAVFKEVTH
jgi:tripartite-type tricarboxylate transporter receptor subunit TctC